MTELFGTVVKGGELFVEFTQLLARVFYKATHPEKFAEPLQDELVNRPLFRMLQYVMVMLLVACR